MLRLIATDLDGTFLTDHTSVDPVNIAAVRAAAEAGIPTLFCTGRPYRWLGFLRDVGSHTHAVTSNGAMIVDLATHTVEQSWPVPTALARSVVADIRAAFPGATFGLEWGDEFGTEVLLRRDEEGRCLIAPVDALLEHRADPAKLIVRHHGIRTDVLTPQIAAVVDDRLSCTYSWVSEDGVVEIAARGVSKAAALEAWCARHGYAADEIAAFGDMPNDLAMLRWVGRPFVMPTAHPSLLNGDFPIVAGAQPTAVGRTIAALLEAGRSDVGRRPDVVG